MEIPFVKISPTQNITILVTAPVPRERQPEVEYYNNEYLVLLAADTVRETEFSDFTLADYAAKMAARATS